MPKFSITVTNGEFRSCNETDLASSESARLYALKGALEMGVEEVCKGDPFFGAEILIESEGGTSERLMVAIGTSALQQ